MKIAKSLSNLIGVLPFLLIGIAIFIISQPTFVGAVSGSIRPARIVAYPSVTIGEINAFTYQIKIGNPGTISSTAYLKPSANLEDYADVSEYYTELGIGEYKTINVTFILKDALMKTGSIRASFSDGVSSAGLETDVSIYPRSAGTANNIDPPTSPSIFSPSNSERFCTDKVTLNWSSSTDPDTSTIAYEWQIDDNNDFSSIINSGITIETQKTIKLAGGKTYFWRVRAYDGTHYSSWVSSSFKINTPYECMNKITELENRINELEGRFNFFESLVNAIKSAVCTLGDFSFCGSNSQQQCAGSDTECGLNGVCQNCNLLDGCYSGYYRDYHCSSQSCAYTESCTETCCDALYGNTEAYCDAGTCHSPQATCTDKCTQGETRCLDSDTKQTCSDYNNDGCTEWGNDEVCSTGCVDGQCAPKCVASGDGCSSNSDCCSNSCVFAKTCISHDFRGICNRYVYSHKCR